MTAAGRDDGTPSRTRGLATPARPGHAAATTPPDLTPDDVDAGLAALAEGRWDAAVTALSAATDATAAADHHRAPALEALSEALWWLGRVDEALAAREQAYGVWRALADDAAAARGAAWLAREYAAAAGNDAAAQGWLERAATLAGQVDAPAVDGWVALTRATLHADPQIAARHARVAVERARAARDGDLEALALGKVGLSAVIDGQVDAGLRCIDEAMAAASGGDAGLTTLAAVCCDLVLAAELSGEIERFAQWNDVIETLAGRHGHPSLVAFCASCCAETFTAAGDWHGAEEQLRQALAALRRTGHRARCVAPAARLADLLVWQGRFEEAEQTLDGVTDDDDTLVPRARVALSRDDPASAVALAERHRRRLGGDSLLTTAAMALLVQAHLAAGEPDRARDVADRMTAIATASGHRRTHGRAALAQARVARSAGDDAAAAAALETALDHLSSTAPGAVETAEARLELARLRADDAPGLAVADARAALDGFEAAGALHAADTAAALLRSLGDRSRVGPKHVGTLTRREQEVLRLVAQGLTNPEIARRLFISPKTAGNHVSNILTKLGMRSRVEAAAYAVARDGA